MNGNFGVETPGELESLGSSRLSASAWQRGLTAYPFDRWTTRPRLLPSD